MHANTPEAQDQPWGAHRNLSLLHMKQLCLLPLIIHLVKRGKLESAFFVPLLVAPHLCRPFWLFRHSFVLLCISGLFNPTMVRTRKVFLPFISSQPAASLSPSSTAFPVVAFDMKHWIFYQLRWIPIQLSFFSWNPSFVFFKTRRYFLKHVYSKFYGQHFVQTCRKEAILVNTLKVISGAEAFVSLGRDKLPLEFNAEVSKRSLDIKRVCFCHNTGKPVVSIWNILGFLDNSVIFSCFHEIESRKAKCLHHYPAFIYLFFGSLAEFYFTPENKIIASLEKYISLLG